MQHLDFQKNPQPKIIAPQKIEKTLKFLISDENRKDELNLEIFKH